MLQKKVPKWQAWIFLNSKTESKNSISLLLLKDPNYHPVSGHKGLQGSILRQRKGLPLLSHLQILKWEATAFQARVPYQWASIYTYTEKGKRERRRSGAEIHWRAGSQWLPPWGGHHWLRIGSCWPNLTLQPTQFPPRRMKWQVWSTPFPFSQAVTTQS